jgi:SHS2 domain-containing protein
MKDYRYLDHTADLGIEVRGQTLENLFENIGIAIFKTQIAGTIRAVKTRKIELFNDILEELFMDWCRELLYNFSVNHFIPSLYDITLHGLSLQAVLKGDTFDPERHRVKIEIKNPTYHELRIITTRTGLKATIVFDV